MGVLRITAWTQSDLGRPVAAGYLVAQAALGVIWWGVLVTVPTVRAWFELLPDRHGALNAFLIADGVVFVAGSVAAAATIWWTSRWASVVTAFTAGGVAYATLSLWGWVVLAGSSATGLVPMTISMVATTLIAIGTQSGAAGHG
jgi:hypothetical protein